MRTVSSADFFSSSTSSCHNIAFLTFLCLPVSKACRSWVASNFSLELFAYSDSLVESSSPLLFLLGMKHSDQSMKLFDDFIDRKDLYWGWSATKLITLNITCLPRNRSPYMNAYMASWNRTKRNRWNNIIGSFLSFSSDRGKETCNQGIIPTSYHNLDRLWIFTIVTRTGQALWDIDFERVFPSAYTSNPIIGCPV